MHVCRDVEYSKWRSGYSNGGKQAASPRKGKKGRRKLSIAVRN